MPVRSFHAGGCRHRRSALALQSRGDTTTRREAYDHQRRKRRPQGRKLPSQVQGGNSTKFLSSSRKHMYPFQFGQVLRTVFKTTRREMSKEIVVLIGNTPYSPKEVYRIPLNHCLVHGADGDCGSHCCQLSRKYILSVSYTFIRRHFRERLEIFKRVGLMEFDDLTRKAKMFLFVRASRQLAALSEWLEEE